MNSHNTRNESMERDNLLKHQLKNWAAQQVPPANLRSQTMIRAAAESVRKEGPPRWLARLQAVFVSQVEQVAGDEVTWAFVHMMGQCMEADAVQLRLVS